MDLKETIRKLTSSLEVRGIVCGRSIKTENGEIFIAFQADSFTLDPGKEHEPMSVKESRAAGYLLALQTDIAAHEHALASGLISQQFCQDKVQSLKTRYAALISNELGAE